MESGIDWGTIGAAVGATATLLGANAWLMKIVISSAINEALLSISEKYVTHAEFDKHIERCPSRLITK